MVIAVTSGLLVNFCFLPPFGTFYIAAPEDWVSFFAYTVTAVVVSHFAATVRCRAVEAGQREAQMARLSRLAVALVAVRKENLTLEVLTRELRTAFELSYCAIYLFGGTGAAIPVSSGTRPSRSSPDAGPPPNLPNTFLDVITEEGPDVRCLSLKDGGETVGALVISQVPLSREAAEALAAVVSLGVRQCVSGRAAG